MPQITLYTLERPGVGLTLTDLRRVRGGVRVQVISNCELIEYPLKWLGASNPSRSNVTPAGKADLHLIKADEKEIDLARCQGAVALVIAARDNTIIYWTKDRLCFEIDDTRPVPSHSRRFKIAAVLQNSSFRRRSPDLATPTLWAT